MHLKGLTELQKLILYGPFITDAGRADPTPVAVVRIWRLPPLSGRDDGQGADTSLSQTVTKPMRCLHDMRRMHALLDRRLLVLRGILPGCR